MILAFESRWRGTCSGPRRAIYNRAFMREAILIFREQSTELLPVEDNYKRLVGLSSCGSISEATLSGLDQRGFASMGA
jgi:hypothetical protein